MNWKHLVGAVAISAGTIALVFRVAALRRAVTGLS
jgi:hypothetical protein